jgi:hypothetical protein
MTDKIEEDTIPKIALEYYFEMQRIYLRLKKAFEEAWKKWRYEIIEEELEKEKE